jgi:hypothetical protein
MEQADIVTRLGLRYFVINTDTIQETYQQGENIWKSRWLSASGQTNKQEYLQVKSNYFQQEHTGQSICDFACNVRFSMLIFALKEIKNQPHEVDWEVLRGVEYSEGTSWVDWWRAEH